MFHLGQDGIARRPKLARINRRADAHQSLPARTVGPRADRVHKTFLLPHSAIEPRAASVPEKRGQDLQRRRIGIPHVRHMPGQVSVTKLDRSFFNLFARAGLDRFFRNHQRSQRLAPGICIGPPDLLDDLPFLNVPGHNIEHIVRNVLLAIIRKDVIRRNGVKYVRIANNGVPEGASGIDRLK